MVAEPHEPAASAPPVQREADAPPMKEEVFATVYLCKKEVAREAPPTALDCSQGLSDEDVAEIAAMPSIVELEVSSQSAPLLERLPQLEALTINEPDRAIVEVAAGLPKLRALTLKTNYNEEDVLLGVEGFASLRRLVWADSVMDYRLWPEISRFSSLQEVDLRDTSVSDTGIEALNALKDLKKLDVRNTQVTSRGVEALRARFPDATILWDESPTRRLEHGGAVLWSSGLVEYKGKRAFINDDTHYRGGSSRLIDEPNDRGKSHMRVVPFDKKTKAIYLFLVDSQGDEDPPSRQVIYLVEPDGLKKVFDGYLGTYGTNRLVFKGDGRVTYTTDDWQAYEDHDNQHHTIVYRLDKKTGRLKRDGAIPTGRFIDPEELSACPFVYVKRGAQYERVGEILRDVRGKKAYTLQGFDMPPSAYEGGSLSLRITEEKRERTFLDELFVVADGRRVEATQCDAQAPSSATRPAWCDADHAAHIMEEGDRFEARFEVGPAKAVALYARGYYIPLTSQ